jgi:hypothetical protein
MKRFWETEMNAEDYIQFLRENSWIWAIKPGWEMEFKLKDAPDTFEMGQILCFECSV